MPLILRIYFPLLALLAMQWLAGVPGAYAQIAFRSAASSSAMAPQFRSASSGTLTTPAFGNATSGLLVGAGTLSIPRPAGLAVNDVLIVSVGVRPNGVTITPVDAGWTLVQRIDNNTGNPNNSLAVYRKVITNLGSEPAANYTFTIAGSTHAAGGILRFTGADTTNPIDVFAGQTTASAPTHTTPSLTTRVNNTIVVATFSYPSAGQWGTYTAGLTERFDQRSPAAANDVGMTVASATRTQATAATVAAQSATASGADDGAGATNILAIRPGLRINLPTGVQAGDTLIASIAIQPSTGLVTPPAGWVFVRQDSQGAATSNTLAIYRKVATGAEPTFYDFSVTNAAFAVGGIQAFFNVDTVSPVNVQGGNGTASANTHTAPAVTPTVAHTMLVTSHTYASSQTWTPPGGMTEGFDQASGAAGAAGQSIEGNYQFIAASGVSTGTRIATAAGATPDAGVASTLALQSPRPRLTINVPAGTTTNDVMIASVAVQPSSATVTAPAGWTLVRQVNNNSGSGTSLYIYRRSVSGVEPASYSWNFSNWAAGYAAGGIQTFSGVDTSNPIDVDSNGTNTGSGLSHTTATVNTTVANTMVVTHHTYKSSGTFVTTSGMSEAFDVASLTAPNADGQSMAGYYVLQAGVGATGTKNADASANADIGIAHILALRPAVVPAEPSSFNAFETTTGAGAITGQIFTKLAGTAFSLDVVAINAGAQLGTFTNTVTVELVANTTGAALDAQNCPTVFTLVQTVAPNPTITNGRSTVNFAAVATAYRDVRVRVRYPTGSPTVTSCSTDNFAIRPVAFSSVASNMTNSGSTGTPVARAGDNFTITAVAGAGYDGTPSINNSLVTAHAGAVQNGSVAGAFGAAASGSGTATGAAFTYSEVGNFTIGVNGVFDSTFTAVDQGPGDCVVGGFSNVLVGGRYGCNFGNSSTTAAIGRFTPDHFNVSFNTPAFATGCTAFTYVGQSFAYTTQPVITVTAQNSAALGNATTRNYTGAWWKLTNTSLTYPGGTNRGYAAFTGTLDVTSVPGTDPVIVDTGGVASGSGTLTFSSGTVGTGLFFARSTPVAPFNAEISLAVNVIDGDAIAYAANPAKFGNEVAGGGIAFSGGNKEMRFGRLRINNANGSQLVALPVLMETQYWNGTAFITNTADACTVINNSNVAMSGFTNNLNACETAVSGGGTFSAGRRTFTFAAPGNGNSGSVTLTANLTTGASGTTCLTVGGATSPAGGANLLHLQGNWTGGAYNQNPSGRATFGIYHGADEFIYNRENF